MDIMNYEDVIKHLGKKKRVKHLLLGNGFSMSYNPNIFSYNSLRDFLSQTNDPLLDRLFNIINTSNFELIMNQLDIFHQIASEFDSPDLAQKILDASDTLKKKLIDAISKMHPEHIFKMSEENSNGCAIFLREYLGSNGHVFSTNYDLLLYWVLMRNQDKLINIVDGFGKEYIEQDEFSQNRELQFGELEWGPNQHSQNIHYLHGALHLFDTGVSIEKETYRVEKYLLTNIQKRVENKHYPIFVTAGDGKQKLEHILHNQYLDYCYKKLSSVSGSLVTFGFSFGKYDYHIIEAINKAAKRNPDDKLWSVYIGVYSDDDVRNIETIKGQFKCKVNVFDAKTVKIWN